jgi:hypothetical protein
MLSTHTPHSRRAAGRQQLDGDVAVWRAVERSVGDVAQQGGVRKVAAAAAGADAARAAAAA